jgi:hypothetical protein
VSRLTLPDGLAWLKHLIPRAGFPLKNGTRYRPFFVVGSGRSGNTLLRRVLYAHPELHIPPETYVLGYAIRLFRQNRNLRWKDLVNLVLSLFEYYPAFDTFGVPTLGPLAVRLGTIPPEQRSLSAILDGFYRYHAEVTESACARWGDKTPDNTYYLDAIRRVFPEAQFIHMVRDGCDVAYSYVETGMFRTEREAAAVWLDMVRRGRRFCRSFPDGCLEVRYEDFVTRPEPVVRNVCGFLGVDFLPGMLDSAEVAARMGDVAALEHHRKVRAPIRADSIGKGRRAFADSQKKAVQEIIGPALEELGYDPCVD